MRPIILNTFGGYNRQVIRSPSSYNHKVIVTSRERAASCINFSKENRGIKGHIDSRVEAFIEGLSW